MTSVENLLRVVCRRRPVTVVYGNLGRHLTDVRRHLDSIFGEEEKKKILFRFGGGRTGGRRNTLDGCCDHLLAADDDPPFECDLLVWSEPHFDAKVERPEGVGRLVAFSSHLELEGIGREDVVAYHHGDAFDPSREEGVPPFEAAAAAASYDDDHDYFYAPQFVPSRPLAELVRSRWRRRKGGGEKKEYGWVEGGRLRADLTRSRCSWEAYLRLLSARDDVRYSLSEGSSFESWSAVLDWNVRKSLARRLLDIRNTVRTKYAAIPCNLNGVDVMLKYYVDPFLEIE